MIGWGRDSVTETIPPIVATKTLNVFNAEEAKVKRVGPPSRGIPSLRRGKVRAHSHNGQPLREKNSYPVQPHDRPATVGRLYGGMSWFKQFPAKRDDYPPILFTNKASDDKIEHPP